MNTLRLDADYSQKRRPSDVPLSELIRYQARKKEIPFEVQDLNKAGLGDVYWMGKGLAHSGEIKGAAEFVGDMDHCEAQLMAQIPNCDRPQLYIYGRMEDGHEGGIYTYSQSNLTSARWVHGERIEWSKDADAEVAQLYKRRHFRRSYAGVRAKLARFSEMGVEVFEVPNLDCLATQIVANYGISQQEGTTFSRLIPQKFFISETDVARRNFMLTLMGIQGAGVGEEMADAIVSWLCRYHTLDLCQLIAALEDKDEYPLAVQPLRSGKRVVGNTAVAKLRTALGL